MHDGPVGTGRGLDPPPGSAAPTPTPTPTPTPALRAHRPGWRDPRLWVGVVLVAASVVLGARLLHTADETVAVWALADDLGAGDAVTAEDLRATEVRFANVSELDRYYRVEERLPSGLTLGRGLGAGELLPRSALGPASAAGTVQVAVAVDDARVPSTVAAGSVVDVYLLGGGDRAAAGRPGRAGEPVLAGVTVLAASLEETYGGAGRRKLELAVPAEAAPGFFALLSGETEPVLSVARRP